MKQIIVTIDYSFYSYFWEAFLIFFNMYLFLAVPDFCCAWASHHTGFSCCRAWAPGAPASRLTGVVAPQHVGSSRTGDLNCPLNCKVVS